MKSFRLVRIIPLLIIIALISACGGGGGGSASSSTTISGVAATGAPIVGAITLKDKNGLTDTATTDSEGNFSLDVAGFTPPFLLKAEWAEGTQTRTLFAASMQTGSVHINPLTNLAVALATGSDPATLFGTGGVDPDTSEISAASLNAAVNQMRTLLDPLLDEYGITEFDPLYGDYEATPENQLDAMLDVISISTASGTVTINNRLTGTVIATGSVTNPAGITLDQTRFPAAAALEDIGEITARVNALGAAMKLGATLTAANLEEFFVVDPNYGTSNGHTRAQDIASIVALFGPGGSNTNGALKELRNVRIVADISSQYTDRGVSKVYILRYDFIYESGTIVHGNNVTFGKETESGLWKFIGDPTGGITGSNYYGVSATDFFANNYGACIGATVSNTAGLTVAYTLDGGMVLSGNLTNLTEGDHTYIITVTDAAGNVSSTSYSWTTDYTPPGTPTVTLTNDTGDSATDKITSDASITVSEPTETVTRTYTVDGVTGSTYIAPTTVGPHTVVVTDTDVAGNTASSTLTFTLENP